MRRIDLDYARGIAILLILIGHADGMSNFAVKLIYSVHVPLFFIVSGILLRYNQTPKKRWSYIFRGWSKRIIIPTLVWELILSFFYYIIKNIKVKQLVKNSLTLNFNLSVLWFIPCLLLAEVVWILFVKCWKKNILFTCLSAVIVFPIIMILLRILFFKRIFVALVFIIFGYVLEDFQGKKVANNYLIVVITGIVWGVTTMINIRVDMSAGVFGNIILYYLHSIAGSVAIIYLCGVLKGRISLLEWFGENTMGILVTHVFVRHVIIAMEEKLLGYFIGGLALAVPMIFCDMGVVFVIDSIFPQIFGKYKKLGDRRL